jgi:hypothetical protein
MTGTLLPVTNPHLSFIFIIIAGAEGNHLITYIYNGGNRIYCGNHWVEFFPVHSFSLLTALHFHPQGQMKNIFGVFFQSFFFTWDFSGKIPG